jgi:hypothetical protein
MSTSVALLVPTIAALVGLVLLVAGGRLLRGAVGLTAALGGAGFGLLIADDLPLQIPPLVAAAILGAIAAIAAVLLARIVMTGMLALSLAAVAPVVAWHLAGLEGGTAVVQDMVAAIEQPQATDAVPSDQEVTDPTPGDAVGLAFGSLARDATTTIQSGVHRAEQAWSTVPTASRALLAGSTLAGLLLGLMIGTFAPRVSSTIVTAAGGAMLLTWGVRAIVAAAMSRESLAPISPPVLFGILTALSVVGILLQLTLARRSRATSPE